MNYKNEFTIQQLRMKNLVKGIESLSVFVGAVIANMLVPQLLIRYVYDPSTLIAPPPVFEYLPLITYGLALLYFVFAMIGNFSRERKARRMEKEVSLYSGCCSDKNCSGENCSNDEDEISEDELKELEKIVDEALKPKKKTKRRAAKKATKKKTVKKTK